MPRSKTNKIDKVIGKKLLALRVKHGLTQTDIGYIIDVTYQQVQKYEKGSSRMSASMLINIAKHFAVPIQYFFQSFEDEQNKIIPLPFFDEKETLLKYFNTIPSRRIRKQMIRMIAMMATGKYEEVI